MAAIVTSILSNFWAAKELEWGRTISVNEVSKVTGIPWETIKGLKNGDTGRFDSHVLAGVCKFFSVPEGSPVPFLTVSYTDSEGQ